MALAYPVSPCLRARALRRRVHFRSSLEYRYLVHLPLNQGSRGLLLCRWKSRRRDSPVVLISHHFWPQPSPWVWSYCGLIVCAENCTPVRALASFSGVWWAVYRQSHIAPLCRAGSASSFPLPIYSISIVRMRVCIKTFYSQFLYVNTGWSVYRLTDSKGYIGDGSSATRETFGTVTLRPPINRTHSAMMVITYVFLSLENYTFWIHVEVCDFNAQNHGRVNFTLRFFLRKYISELNVSPSFLPIIKLQTLILLTWIYFKKTMIVIPLGTFRT
jgi:hypothetical protein